MSDPDLERRTRAAFQLVKVAAGVVAALILVTFVVISLPRCGESSERATGTAGASAASDSRGTNQQRLDWIINRGWAARDNVQRHCLRLTQCTILFAAGQDGSPASPGGMLPCIEARRATCEQTLQQLRGPAFTSVPPEFQLFVRGLEHDAAHSLCVADVHRVLLNERPEVVEALQAQTNPQTGEITGWQSPADWLERNERSGPPWVRAYSESIADCHRSFPDWTQPNDGELAAWLRARYDCSAVGGECTMERLRELAERGVQPTPRR